MEKVRVYELAKELNTTSKRLIEKLAEININVKNHMSILNEEQLDALYDHIGVIRHNRDEKKESQKAEASQQKVSAAKDKKDKRKGPTIIRKTKIIVDSDNNKDAKNTSNSEERPRNQKNEGKRGGRGRRKSRDFVKVADDTSGLRAGFVRDTSHDLRTLAKQEIAKQQEKTSKKKEENQEQQLNAGKKDEVNKTHKTTDKQANKADKEGIKKEVQQRTDVKPKNKVKTDAEKQDEIKQEESKKDMSTIVEAKDNKKMARELKEKTTTKQVEKQADKKKDNKEDKKGQDDLQIGKKIGMDIQQPESSSAQKDKVPSQHKEVKRESRNRENDNINKKDIKKESVKSKRKRFSPKNTALTEKKQVSEVLSEDFILDEFYSDDDVKKVKSPAKTKKDETHKKEKKNTPPKPALTTVKIPESITVKELAEALKKTSSEVIKKLMGMGLMVTVNEEIDFDTAAIIADEFGMEVEKEVVVSEEDILFDESQDDEEDLEPRPPVVVVMGHVDHGKTSLLDAIKETNVIDTEAGGITQHIGAYMVDVNGRKITFLDTPGHEAFTAMRARGAQVTDIAILVVAADDGVMPQTVEAINHAKAANVNIIVAVNKIDKPGANPDKVKQELTEHGLVPEEWGGDIICVNVSALKKQNIEELLEMVLLSADMLELKASPRKQAKGTVIEAKLDKGRGAVATLLVQRGTLRVGDFIIAGGAVGRIRAMVDDKGNNIKEAGPSTPVEIIGLSEVPEAGETFYQVEDEKLAKQLAEKRKERQREEQLKASSRVSLDDLFNQIKEGQVKDLNIIVKADVQGSVEAVKQSLEKLSNEEVRVRIIHGGVGTVTESDVKLAEVSNAIIIGFNVRPSANVKEAAENANVDIRLYRVIYDAIEDIQNAMKGMLEPTYKEVILGHAEVRQIFKVSGIGTIGGCYVTDGKIVRNSEVRIVRDGVVVHEGKLASLKRFKDDVKEVAQGFECGLSIEKFNDIKEGDVVESYIMEEVER